MSFGIGGFNFSPSCNSASSMAASSAKEAARDAKSQVRQIGGEIERLLMITEALWIFMREQHGYTDEDLIKKIAEIDLRDGKLDGKVSAAPAEVKRCANCDRPVGKKRATCLYCGSAVVQDPFER